MPTKTYSCCWSLSGENLQPPQPPQPQLRGSDEFLDLESSCRFCLFILFVTSMHQFPNLPIHDFFYQNIYLFIVFSGLKSSNLFLILRGHLNAFEFHSIIRVIITPNFVKNIRVLVKINWWIDVTNKIILTPDFGYWCKRCCNTGLKWSGARGVCKKPENYKRMMSRLWKFLYYYFLTERRLAV